MDPDGQLGVLGHAPLRPPARFLQGAAADETHGPNRERGIVLVQGNHRRCEEISILPVAHSEIGTALPFPVVVRGLDETNARVVEVSDEPRQEVRVGQIVGIDHADDFGVTGRLGESEVEGPRLGPGPGVQVEEAKTGAETPTMSFHRSPQRGILGVVVDHEHLEVRIVEGGQGIEGGGHQLRRFGIRGNVQRHLRVSRAVLRGAPAGGLPPATPGRAAQRLPVGDALEQPRREGHHKEWITGQQQGPSQWAHGNRQEKPDAPDREPHDHPDIGHQEEPTCRTEVR
jgi:hypothetical protein